MRASVTLNRTKIEEIGRKGIVDWRVSSPTVNVSLRQLEYGSIEFWQMLGNVSTNKVEWSDFENSQGDIVGYKT
jgi:hypothetical protein